MLVDHRVRMVEAFVRQKGRSAATDLSRRYLQNGDTLKWRWLRVCLDIIDLQADEARCHGKIMADLRAVGLGVGADRTGPR